MSIESLKAFMKKTATIETCALTDDELDLVTGGTRDNSIKFLESYCIKIPLHDIRLECELVLASLKESY